MPIYEFVCQECDAEFEEICNVDTPPPPCPECQSPKSQKLVSQSAFHLKGEGWYASGYTKDKPPKKADTDSKTKDKKKDSSAPSKSDKTKTESKKGQ